MKNNRLPVDFVVVMAMVVVLVLPFALTLMTIAGPRAVLEADSYNSPRGYTWSLSLFIVPVIVLGTWLCRRRESRVQQRAFWLTTSFVALAGILLDVFFGATFFTFPNRGATMGLWFHGYSFARGWDNKLPIEEIGFYVFGGLAVMLIYIWGDEFWFGAYNIDDGPRRRTRWREVISFHPGSAIVGVVVFLLGFGYKKFLSPADPEGFPGYFLFLTLVALIPSILFFPVASPYINWRAFSLGLLFILLVSLFWEATIAVPYQWWGFQPRPMLGLFINGFSGLPIEEPLLWGGVTWATVIMYETIYTVLLIERS